MLATEVIQTSRLLNSGELKGVCFNEMWARDFKRWQGWRWKSADTDRKPSTSADIVEDNKWRKLVLDVFDNPDHHGIPMSSDHTAIAKSFRLAMDETPLKYFLDSKGTYKV